MKALGFLTGARCDGETLAAYGMVDLRWTSGGRVQSQTYQDLIFPRSSDPVIAELKEHQRLKPDPLA